MKRASAILVVAGALLGNAAWALTSLERVTPKNLEKNRFTLCTNAGPNKTVEFVISRDVERIELPGKRAFLKDTKSDPKSLGTPIKLEEEGHKLFFRFSVPEKKVADTEFWIWGHGTAGEGVTFEFQLREFWKPKKD